MLSSFKKWLEFSDAGGEVSYNHMNNVVAGDGFNKLKSKWMASDKKVIEDKPEIDKIFGKKKSNKIHK
jgi:hypothetical protein